MTAYAGQSGVRFAEQSGHYPGVSLKLDARRVASSLNGFVPGWTLAAIWGMKLSCLPPGDGRRHNLEVTCLVRVSPVMVTEVCGVYPSPGRDDQRHLRMSRLNSARHFCPLSLCFKHPACSQKVGPSPPISVRARCYSRIARRAELVDLAGAWGQHWRRQAPPEEVRSAERRAA